MKLFSHFTALALLTGTAIAELPTMQEKDWLGVFAAMEGRNYDFKVRTHGGSEMLMKKNKKVVSIHSVFAVRCVLLEQEGKKWVKRTLDKDSLESKQEASLDLEKVAYTANFTGDTKLGITHEFDGEEVLVGVKVLEKKTKNPLRIGMEVVVPDLYKLHGKDKPTEREMKKKLKDFEIRMISTDGKTKLKLDGGDVVEEEFKLDAKDQLGDKTVKYFSIESDKMGDNQLVLTTEEEDYGEMEIKQTKPLYHGLTVRWFPKEDKIGKEGCRLKIEVK